MTESVVETVRRFYDALAGGDPASALAVLGAEVEWHEAPGMPYEGTRPYRGAAEVAEHVLGPIGEDVEGLTLAELDFRELGDTVLVLGRYQGVARPTGTSLDEPFAHVWRLSGPTPIEFRQYTDTAAFARALVRASTTRSM